MKATVFFGILALAATQTLADSSEESSYGSSDEGSGEMPMGHGMPQASLTFDEIRELGSNFSARLQALDLSLTPILEGKSTADITENDIFMGLFDAGSTLKKFRGESMKIQKALDDAEKRAVMFGLNLRKPCGEALRNLQRQDTNKTDFVVMAMFWEAVKLDMRCIRDFVREMSAPLAFFANINDMAGSDEVDKSLALLRLYSAHVRRASRDLQFIVRGAIHVVQNNFNGTLPEGNTTKTQNKTMGRGKGPNGNRTGPKSKTPASKSGKKSNKKMGKRSMSKRHG